MNTITKRTIARIFFVVLSLGACSAHANEASDWGKDVPQSVDHPLIKRFTGSWLTGYSSAEWDAARLPTSANLDNDKKFKDVQTIEGKQTRIIYLAPRGKMPLEVFRNYQQALINAGLKVRFTCELQCNALYSAWNDLSKPTAGMQWATGSIYTPTDSRYSHSSALSSNKGMMLMGTMKRGAQETIVFLYTSIAAYEATGLTQTYLHIAEPKSMQIGQVSVDATAIQSGLQEEGKIALTGLFFDTAKAVIKDESKTQLEEMAKLMKAQPTHKFFIVGHTDNVGNFDSNMNLSLQRAQAVVSALIAAPYRVEASRLVAKGNANLSPLASNTEEAGRARNRRVELVAQ